MGRMILKFKFQSGLGDQLKNIKIKDEREYESK